jgi:hypothetical protein
MLVSALLSNSPAIPIPNDVDFDTFYRLREFLLNTRSEAFLPVAARYNV